MQTMKEADFLEPQGTLSVNGFPLPFRPLMLDSGITAYVPKGISRNPEARCWRVYMSHEDGLISQSVGDKDHASEMASLTAATNLLIDALQGRISRFKTDCRARAQGPEKDPVIDSGHTGVLISRTASAGNKAIVVTVQQTIAPPNRPLNHSHLYVGRIPESAVLEGGAQARLNHLLRKAISIRRVYNRFRSEGGHPSDFLRHKNVPDDILKTPVQMPNLDVCEIMDSFIVKPRPFVPRTTGGDPEALSVTLQQQSLLSPLSSCWLNGHELKFRETLVEGSRFFLPKQLFRARGRWRVRVYHSEGIFDDSVMDEEFGGDLNQSLPIAWTYLVSTLRNLDAREFSQKTINIPLLDTGVAGASISLSCRKRTKTRPQLWEFTFLIKIKISDGRQFRRILESRTLSKLTQETLDEALRKAVAIREYRDHLVNAGETVSAENLTKEAGIPANFWPDSPPVEISIDDLRYMAEQKEKAGG